MRRIFVYCAIVLVAGCQTKGDIRREQELERVKSELKDVRGDRADVETISEEMRVEIGRLNNLVEERAQRSQTTTEKLRAEVQELSNRMKNLEDRIAAAEAEERARIAEEKKSVAAAPEKKATFEQGKRYYEDGRYAEAVEVLRFVSRAKPKSEEGKKAQFLLGESYFANREFASAALEFSEYKKAYPKDKDVPLAIYRQANAFRSMNKPKEAKLFYQELIDRFAKSPLVVKAKQELKRLK